MTDLIIGHEGLILAADAILIAAVIIVLIVKNHKKMKRWEAENGKSSRDID